MITRKEDMAVKESSLRNGQGLITQIQIVEQANMIHSKMFSKLIIRKDCSIGYHEHVGEVEYYYILSGEGIVTEPEGDKKVKPGDVVITGWGAGHSIRNENIEDLVLIAFISTEA